MNSHSKDDYILFNDLIYKKLVVILTTINGSEAKLSIRIVHLSIEGISVDRLKAIASTSFYYFSKAVICICILLNFFKAIFCVCVTIY